MAGFRGLARFLRDLRVVWWFVAALLAFFAADKARATEYAIYATSADAYAACLAQDASYPPPVTADGIYNYHCAYAPGTYNSTYNKGNYTIRAKFNGVTHYDRFWFREYGCVAPATWDSATGQCVGGTSPEDIACADALAYDQNIQYPNGSVHCDATTECMMTAVNIGDGGPVRLIPYEQDEGVGDACTPTDDCPPDMSPDLGTVGIGSEIVCLPDDGDADEDGLNNDEDPTPNEYGDAARDTDGDGTPDSRDPFPLDPDNGQSLEDGETSATSSGGGNCSSPPVVNGDAVGAQVAYQTWATRCAVDRLNSTMKGGTASVTVVGGGTGSGDSTEGEIEGMSDGEGMASDGVAAGLTQNMEFGADGLDDMLFGAQVGGTCPDIPPIDLGAMGTLDIDSSLFCEWMQLTSILVLILAALGSLRIIGGA